MPDPSTTASNDLLRQELADAVRRVRDGDPRAFQTIVERCQRPLFHVLCRYVDDRDDALDLTQQAFVRAFEQLDTLAQPDALRAWLFRIGINLALGRARSRARRPTVALDEAPEPQIDASVERELAHRQQLARVRNALPSLSPKQRDVLLLRVDADLSYAEVAQATDSTEGAVRVHFHQALKRLRELLADDATEPQERGR